MKKLPKVFYVLSCSFFLIACQGLSSFSRSQEDSSSLSFSSSQSQDNASSLSLSFSSNPNQKEISQDEANNIADEITNKAKVVTPKKLTTRRKKTRHYYVRENLYTSTYSVKDYDEEEIVINEFDTTDSWYHYTSHKIEHTTYFVEEPLVRHLDVERWIFYKDGTIFTVYDNNTYYEGKEDKAKIEKYYYRAEEELDVVAGYFIPGVDQYCYFNKSTNSAVEQTGLDKIDQILMTSFSRSSSFYTLDEPRQFQRNTSCSYYATDEKGSFSCKVDDATTYRLSDLRDWPSVEENLLGSISYRQDYQINIANYFDYLENSKITTIAKDKSSKDLRNEVRESEALVLQTCREAFYPDLNKYELKESGVTK